MQINWAVMSSLQSVCWSTFQIVILHSIIANSVYAQIKLEPLTLIDYEYGILCKICPTLDNLLQIFQILIVWYFQTDLGTWILNSYNLMREFSHRDNSGLPHPSIRAPVILPPHTHTHLNVHNFLIAAIKNNSKMLGSQYLRWFSLDTDWNIFGSQNQ